MDMKGSELSGGNKGLRERFIAYCFESFRSNRVAYCVLRGHENLLSGVDKDIDLLMDPNCFDLAIELFGKAVAEFGGIRVIATGRGKSLYLKAILLNEPNTVEAIYMHAVAYVLAKTAARQLDHRGLGHRVWFQDISTVETNVGGVTVFIPSAEYRLLFLMSRYLQRPKKEYLELCLRLLSDCELDGRIDNPETVRAIENALGGGVNSDGRHALCGLVDSFVNRLTKAGMIRHTSRFMPLIRFNLMHGLARRGVLIFFSGPDGSGKTTANELLSDYLRNALGISVLNTKHLYPSSMRLGKQSRKVQAMIRGIDPTDMRRVERDRGQGLGWKTRRLMGLLLLLAQVWPGYVWARYKNIRGYSVIVDTAFFDVFIKGHRPQFPLLEAMFSPLIPCGDAWFVMRADAARIMARKPELTGDEIQEYYRRLDAIESKSRCMSLGVASDEGVNKVLFNMLMVLRNSRH